MSAFRRYLSALRDYQIPETAPVQANDKFTQFVAFICGALIALISLLGLIRYWIKSNEDLEVTETPIEQGFVRMPSKVEN